MPIPTERAVPRDSRVRPETPCWLSSTSAAVAARGSIQTLDRRGGRDDLAVVHIEEEAVGHPGREALPDEDVGPVVAPPQGLHLHPQQGGRFAERRQHVL